MDENDRRASAGVGLIDLIGGSTRYGVNHGTGLLFANDRRRVGNPSYAVDWADAGGEADGVVNDQPAWSVVGDRICRDVVRSWSNGLAPHRQADRSRDRDLTLPGALPGRSAFAGVLAGR